MYVLNCYFIIFTGTLLVWLLTEGWLLFRDRRVESKGNKVKGRLVYGFFITAFLASCLLSHYRLAAMPINPDSRLLFGTLIIWGGLVVRWWAILTLGKYFNVVVTVRSGQKIIKKGPYKYIRHPSYTGSILVCVGVGLGLGNWIGLAVIFILPVVSYILRAMVEEKVMVSSFGNDYLVYMRQTSRFIPFIH